MFPSSVYDGAEQSFRLYNENGKKNRPHYSCLAYFKLCKYFLWDLLICISVF